MLLYSFTASVYTPCKILQVSVGREDGSWSSLRTRKTHISQDTQSCHLMNNQVDVLMVQTANKPLLRQRFCHSGIAYQIPSVKNSKSTSSVPIPASLEKLILQIRDLHKIKEVRVKWYFPLKILHANMDKNT